MPIPQLGGGVLASGRCFLLGHVYTHLVFTAPDRLFVPIEAASEPVGHDVSLAPPVS